jgi:hypothetical protein
MWLVWAWNISDKDAAGLLAGEVSTPTLSDVRAQFARWATNAPDRVFESLADAWNSFASPKLGRSHPVVLLPASMCYRCINVRGLTGQRADASCGVCGGSGRRKPRAFRAVHASNDSFCTSFDNAESAEGSGGAEGSAGAASATGESNDSKVFDEFDEFDDLDDLDAPGRVDGLVESAGDGSAPGDGAGGAR